MSSESETNLGASSSDYDLDPDDSNGRTGSRLWGLILKIPRKARIVLTIILHTILVIGLLSYFQPKAKKRSIPETVVKVDVIDVTQSAYPIVVNTNGTIQADTRGNLVAQVSGEIVKVSDRFRTGGAFTQGETLIEVDKRDFLAAQSQAAAQLSQAQVAYRQEQENAKQAIRDWQRLGNTGPVPDLVGRKPQLAAAQAQLDSAKANFDTAKLNLERTNITAPYTGRVIRRDAVPGQYVGTGTVLAEIFATDAVEVRLPVSQDEYSQLGLDSLGDDANKTAFDVLLASQVGSNRFTWDAKVTRTDSAFDLSTRQIDVIATVKDPFSQNLDSGRRPALKIGQFVNARIQGRTVDDVFVVPNKALREGNYVFVVKNERLVRTPVTVAWQDDENALVESGLNTGDMVVTTSLNSTLAGAKVKLTNAVVNDDSPAEPQAAISEETSAEDSNGDEVSSINDDSPQQPAAASENSDQPVDNIDDPNRQDSSANQN